MLLKQCMLDSQYKNGTQTERHNDKLAGLSELGDEEERGAGRWREPREECQTPKSTDMRLNNTARTDNLYKNTLF